MMMVGVLWASVATGETSAAEGKERKRTNRRHYTRCIRTTTSALAAAVSVTLAENNPGCRSNTDEQTECCWRFTISHPLCSSLLLLLLPCHYPHVVTHSAGVLCVCRPRLATTAVGRWVIMTHGSGWAFDPPPRTVSGRSKGRVWVLQVTWIGCEFLVWDGSSWARGRDWVVEWLWFSLV